MKQFAQTSLVYVHVMSLVVGILLLFGKSQRSTFNIFILFEVVLDGPPLPVKHSGISDKFGPIQVVFRYEV